LVTDPPYGILSDYEGKASRKRVWPGQTFSVSIRNGLLEVIADDFNKPNGIAFSPDEKTFISSTQAFQHTHEGQTPIRTFRDGKAG